MAALAGTSHSRVWQLVGKQGAPSPLSLTRLEFAVERFAGWQGMQFRHALPAAYRSRPAHITCRVRFADQR